MKIGLFGGLFNFVYNGYIKIVEFVYKILGLDKIYFIFIVISLFKKKN